MSEPILILACGALVRELAALRQLNGWTNVAIRGLPQRLHAAPQQIAGAVRAAVAEQRRSYSRIFVAYADCGTRGALDLALDELGVERLPGAHCYEVLSGRAEFERLAADEPGSFYLTDFLARHFERLVVAPLGLDRRPELLPLYFANYRRVVFLSQSGSAELRGLAQAHAARLGLEFAERRTGLEPLRRALAALPLAAAT